MSGGKKAVSGVEPHLLRVTIGIENDKAPQNKVGITWQKKRRSRLKFAGKFASRPWRADKIISHFR